MKCQKSPPPFSCRADLVLQSDVGEIEPAAGGDRELARHVEGVDRVEAGIGVGRAERDRAVGHRVARRSEIDAVAGDDIIGLDDSELRGRAEIRDAIVEARADDEMIIVAEQLVGVGPLQGRAGARRLRVRVVDLAEGRAGRKVIDELLSVEPVGGSDRVVEAEEPGRAALGRVARLHIGRIAVLRRLIETAHVRVALQAPGRRDVHIGGDVDVAHLVGRGLRRRVDVAPVLLQQFNRRCAGRAEKIIGGADVDVKFVAVVPVADVAIEPADVRGPELAIAVVVGALDRDIGGPGTDHLAPLQRGLRAAIGAAHHIDRRSLPGEPVLHLHRDRAAERVEAEGGVVADDVHRSDGDGRNQIPIHGVAERFVDADAVLVDGEALRRARDRRGVEAAEKDVGLEGIARDILHVDAGRILREGFDDARQLLALDFLGVDYGHRSWNLVHVDAGAG